MTILSLSLSASFVMALLFSFALLAVNMQRAASTVLSQTQNSSGMTTNPAMYIPFSIVAVLGLGFWALNPFLRAVMRTAFWIAFERVVGHNTKDFPQVGPDAAAQVSNPVWLTHALTVKFPGTKVLSATAQEMGTDQGNASTLFRLAIEYEENPTALPRNMICKLLKPGMASRIAFTAARMNEMEAKFYGSELSDELVNNGTIHVPRGFAGKYSTRGGDCYSLIEDLSTQNLTFPREVEPVESMQQAIEIARALGKFHGKFFNKTARFQTDLSWIIQQRDPVLCMTGQAFTAGWQKFLARYEGKLPQEVVERGHLLGGVAQLLHDYMGTAPQVVVHGDCHLQNAYFTEQGELGVYDFQLLRIGRGVIDLATFLGGSMHSNLLGGGLTHTSGEEMMLREYYDALQQNDEGALRYVEDSSKPDGEANHEYTFQDLLHDYKLALALVFVWNVAASLAIPFNTKAAEDYDAYALRLVNSVQRTSAINHAVWVFGLQTYTQAKPGLRRASKPRLDAWLQTPPIQRSLPGEATHLEHQVELHVAEVKPEAPQSLIDSFLWKPLKYQFIKSKTQSKQGYHGKKTSEVDVLTMESHHDVSYANGTEMEPYVLDSYYLSSFSKEHNFSLRWCRRSNEDAGEVWLVLRLAHNTTLVWNEHPRTIVRCYELDDKTMCVSNHLAKMEITLVEPMKRWNVRFSGYLKQQTTGELVKVEFDLETTSIMPYFSFGTHVDASLTAKALSNERFSAALFAELQATHQEHYEQFCEVTGHIQVLGDEAGRTQVMGKGMRDRAFGCRQWSYMQRYVASYLVCDNGMVVSFAQASLPTLTNAKFGMVFGFENCQEFSAINAMSGNLSELAPDGIPPQEWELAFRTANGWNFKIRAFVDGDALGLNMGPDEMWIHLRFARYHLIMVDPKTGVLSETWARGASEFGYRIAGKEPLRPLKGVFDPVFAAAGGKDKNPAEVVVVTQKPDEEKPKSEEGVVEEKNATQKTTVVQESTFTVKKNQDTSAAAVGSSGIKEPISSSTEPGVQNVETKLEG